MPTSLSDRVFSYLRRVGLFEKSAQSVIFGGGPVTYPTRRVSSTIPASKPPISNFRKMWSYIDAARKTGYYDDISANEEAVRRFEQGYPTSDYATASQLRREGYIPEDVSLIPTSGSPLSAEYRLTESGDGVTYKTLMVPTNSAGLYPRSLVAHEAGHHSDLTNRIQSGRISTGRSLVDQFTAPYAPQVHKTTLNQAADPEHNTEMSDEITAWNRATGKYDPHIRSGALETYRTAAEAQYRQAYGDALDLLPDYELENRTPGRGMRGFANVTRGRLPKDVRLGPVSGLKIPVSVIDNYLRTHTKDQAFDHVYDFIGRDAKDQFKYRTGGQR